MYRRHVWSCIGCVLVSALVLAAPANGDPPNYVFISLDSAGLYSSTASGVFDGYQVGGAIPHFYGSERAQMWSSSPSSNVDLHPDGFSESRAEGIDGGQQVGWGRSSADGQAHALLWSGTAGSVVDLHPAGFFSSSASGISGGQQVGSGRATSASQYHALLWSGTAASVVDLSPAGYSASTAFAVSDGNQVGWGQVGSVQHALLWSGTAASVVDLHPADFTTSSAYGVSADQQVGSGRSAGDDEQHALLWSGTGASVVDLHPDGFTNSVALAAAGDRQVGWGNTENAHHALLWSGTAESAIDLNTYVPADRSSSEARGVEASGNIVGEVFHADAYDAALWWLTGTVQAPAFTIGDGSTLDSITLDAQKSLQVSGTLTIESGASLALDGTAVFAGTIAHHGMLSGHGAATGKVQGSRGSEIIADGDLSLGDATSFQGFATDGRLSVGGHHVQLHTKGLAVLGGLTEIGGGTLEAANGIALSVGGNLTGSGTVAGRVAAGFGAMIEATGNLSLGDGGAYDGFSSDGVLSVGGHTVTLHDRNEAAVGSLTTLAGGTLAAPNGLLVEFGKNVVGRGTVETPDDSAKPLINNGAIAGDNAGDPIVLPGYVKGVGTFDNVVFSGTFAPGLSPAIVDLGNASFAAESRLQIEIGGLTPGQQHDKLAASGRLSLAGTLDISLIDGFAPQYGDEFEILAADALGGRFDRIVGLDVGPDMAMATIYEADRVKLVAAIPGDADVDGKVGVLDYLAMKRYLGSTTGRTWLAGDFDGDSDVDAADFSLLRSHFGWSIVDFQVVATDAGAVPEPAILSLLLLGSPVILRRRRRR